MEKKPFIFAICGAKNTGKTTLITQLIAAFTARGLKVATIKHDGHDFSADVPNTDTYRHMVAGAYGTAVFSDNKFMVVKVQPKTPASEMAALFPEADIILVEGCKSSAYPKMQMLHSGEEEQLICNQLNFVGYIADGTMEIEGVPCYHRNDVEGIAEAILTEKFIRTELSMIVLAGGKSQRMGRDKADLPYGE
ncbi:MAG: molybdopterin-guanine dinucleotide biosynthesis protein B, partial [Oscillospiraceae bacterium]|nr:molybdopterin-guanine dinucleotide biosynthesis protein B [Oscillospiraceae bacterium]